MKSLDVDELHMSGARAVFRSRKPPKEYAVAAAFEEQGMQLESYEKLRRPRARGKYLVDTGVT